ncbi:MAG TPA: hypothetical protein GXX36_12560 [Clostridiaceae bacterium]|nr:hypothetical protein [Clostridiaceae bacterium]
MKKRFSLFLVIALTFSLLFGSLNTYAADWSDGSSGFSDDPSYWGDNYKTWSQGAAEYGSYLNKYGCWVVAMSKLLMETGGVPEGFNPGVFLRWEKENGYIDKNFMQKHISGSGAAPVVYAKQYGVTMTVKDYPGYMSEADMLKLLKEGKYLIVKVKPDSVSHFVYVARDESLQYGKIYYWDSWSSTNNTNKRHKTVDKLQPYNTSGYGVYHVWAYSVVSKETNQTNNSQTTPPASPPTAPPTVPPAGNLPGPVPAAVTEGWIPASNLPEGAKVTTRK